MYSPLRVAQRSFRAEQNIIECMREYAFLETFMKSHCSSDPVKLQWPELKRWQIECYINPNITTNRFQSIQQKYELFPLLEDRNTLEVDGNDFLSKTKDNLLDNKLLTDRHFECAQFGVNEIRFRESIDSIFDDASDSIIRLFGKNNMHYLHRQLIFWSKYEHGSFGHPYIVSLRDEMSRTGTLSTSKVLDVCYYLMQLMQYKWRNWSDDVDRESNLRRCRMDYDKFQKPLRWFRKHNIRTEDGYLRITNDEQSLYHSMNLMHFWNLQTIRFQNLERIVVEVSRLLGKNTKKTRDGLMSWIGTLGNMERDPFFDYLWHRLSNEDGWKSEDLQKRIKRRWELNIGDLMEKHCDVLVPLIYREKNKASDPSIIDDLERLRSKVLLGDEIGDPLLMEISELLASEKS